MGRSLSAPQALVAVAALAVAGALFSALAAAGSDEPPFPARPPAVPADDPAPPSEAPDAVRAAPTGLERALRRGRGHVVLRPAPGGEVVVRARPGGPVVARVGGRTEFGSPATLSLAARRGRWLGVVVAHLPNGRLGWVDPEEIPLRASTTRVGVTVDLSARTLVVKRGRRVLHRMDVGVGRAGTPTPTGRFAVTDKIDGTPFGATYGCCILALSGHQPNLPQGWRGGDRLAVHGTSDQSSIGSAASTGCLRARDADLRALLRVVPLGAPVTIRG